MHGYKWPINCTRTRTGSKLSSLKALQKEEDRDRAFRAEEEAIRRRMLVGGLTVQEGDTLRARLEFIRRQLGRAQRVVRINGEAIDMNASYAWGSREGIIQEQRRKVRMRSLMRASKLYGNLSHAWFVRLSCSKSRRSYSHPARLTAESCGHRHLRGVAQYAP